MLVDACPDRLSFPAFLTHLESGLKVLRCLPAQHSAPRSCTRSHHRCCPRRCEE